jgi:cytidylate kinase
MKCPFCDHGGTRVIDSRQTDDGHAIRRRRICDHCGRRFTTYEKVEESTLMVVKKDGRREAFSRSKVIGGIVKATEKRPVSMKQIEEMASRIERNLSSRMDKEVPSEKIGELVMDELRAVDQVAYIRFASVYRQFTDVETFAREIDKLRAEHNEQEDWKVTALPEGEIIRIAIDGPSGAGKSTIAKKAAEKLHVDYIDTGAMYRAVGLKMRRENIQPEDEKALKDMLGRTEINFIDGKIYLDGRDVEKEIRTPEISAAASECAQVGAVREKLVAVQRKIGHEKSVIMDGRDIGTNVFKDAQFKFYLTAEPEERARRRYKELQERGEHVSYEEILKDVKDRDYRDTHRKLNPLKKADDAMEIDSTNMNIEEVVDEICTSILERCNHAQ